MKKKINIELERQLHELLEKHDKTYVQSDDMRIFLKGERERDEIIDFLVKKLDFSAKQSYRFYEEKVRGVKYE